MGVTSSALLTPLELPNESYSTTQCNKSTEPPHVLAGSGFKNDTMTCHQPLLYCKEQHVSNNKVWTYFTLAKTAASSSIRPDRSRLVDSTSMR